MLNKIGNYLLYAFALLLPWQTRYIFRQGEIAGGASEYSTISLYVVDIVILSALLLFSVDLWRRRREAGTAFKGSKMAWLIVVFLIIAVGSILSVIDKSVGLFDAGRLFVASLAVLAIHFRALDKRKFLKILLISLAIQGILGTYQFTQQKSFASKWFGLAHHESSAGGSSVVEFMGEDGLGQRWLRAYGGQDHPNIFGGLMVFGLLLALYLSFTNEPEDGDDRFIDGDLLLMILIFFIGTVVSFSRAAWLAFVIGWLILFVISILKKEKGKQLQVLKIFLFSILIIVSMIFFYGGLIKVRIMGGTRLEMKSTQERIASYKQAWPILKEHYLLGTGIGGYVNTLEKNIPNQPSWFYQPVHNSLLLMLIELGVFGFVAFSAIMYLLFQRLWREKKAAQIYKLPILLALLVMMMLDHWFWSLHIGIFVLALVMWFVWDDKI